MSSAGKLSCVECGYVKETSKKFECGHNICPECLCLLLIEKEYNYEKIEKELKLQCPECESAKKHEEISLKLTKDDLKKFYDAAKTKSKNPLKCQKHNKDIKFYCDNCNSEMCEECTSLDKDHANVHIELSEIKDDEADKLLQNQCLNENDVKNKINSCKTKVETELKNSLEKAKEKINSLINLLNDLIKNMENENKNNSKKLQDFFDLMQINYDHYYSMIKSAQLPLKSIKSMSSMKNILDANLVNNLEVLENLDNLSEYLSKKTNELKEKSPCTIDLKFKEGLVQTGNCYTFNTPHKEFLLTADFINNQNNFFTSATDHFLKIYEKKIEKNKLVFKQIKEIYNKKNLITSLLNINNSQFATGNYDGLISIWNTEEFEVEKFFSGHTSQIRKIIKQNNTTIISCSDDHLIKAWDLDSYDADCIYTLEGHEDKINDILLDDLFDQNTLISVSDDKTVRIWNLEMKECVNAIKTQDIQTCLGKLKNGRFMMGGEDGCITIFNYDGFVPVSSITAHSEPVQILKEQPDTGYIISGGQDNLVKIFDSENGSCLKILDGHKNTIINFVQIDNEKILTASADKTIKVWDL